MVGVIGHGGTWIKEVGKYRVVLGANSDCTKTIAYQTAEGPVSDFIQNDNVPWDNLKRELTTRFAEITDTQPAMYVLRRTKQKSAETVQLFAEQNPEPPESKHKKLHVTKNRKTWFNERQKAKTFGCAWPSKKLHRGDHAEVTSIPPPSNMNWCIFLILLIHH